jgi:aryl-alcohol dehydrogenase-like predicted oxidoreductase
MIKIAIGTAQFGMNYGINNNRGMIQPNEAFCILDEAVRAGIDTVDTAYCYGSSENLIGDYTRAGRRNLKVISKQPKCSHVETEKFFTGSLRRIGAQTLYGYLIHSFEDYKRDEATWVELEKLKRKGMVNKIGFSLYSPFELEHILKRGLAVDIIQIPFSIFDQRFIPYLSEMKRRKMDIYARSVFLQGLVFKDPNELDSHFVKISDKIKALGLLAAKLNISIASLCVNFVIANEYIHKAVVGLDSLENLIEIIRVSQNACLPKNIAHEISGLRIDDDGILLPFNWKLSKDRTWQTR